MVCFSNTDAVGRSCKMKKTPSFDQDFCVLLKLASLAEKMESDCYSEEKSSKEIMQDFLIRIKNLRDGL